MKANGILAAIGGTPLIKLSRSCRSYNFQVWVKLESLNPGGSTKDRPAFNIIKSALDSGAIGPGTVIIESSSGNMGIGLAQVCAWYGLRFICVIDAKTASQNIRLLKAYGAEISMVSRADPETGEFLPARINRVKELLETIDNSFWVDQYSSENNSSAHHKTMEEIAVALDGKVDYLFCATSTCGTIRGCSEYVSQHGLRTRIIAVDAVGSVIFGGEKAKRLLPGHGAAVRPKLFQPHLADQCVLVTDLDCVLGCRRLVREEAILAGGSSGGVFAALTRLAPEIPSGANCVLVFTDRGERYLDTVYSDEWVAEHFGDVQC